MGRRRKDDKLMVKWSKTENDLMIFYPNREDGHFMSGILSSKRVSLPLENINKIAFDAIKYDKSLREELEKRGYDLTTLRIEISKKKKDDQFCD